jgi:hypothetical protein
VSEILEPDPILDPPSLLSEINSPPEPIQATQEPAQGASSHSNHSNHPNHPETHTDRPGASPSHSGLPATASVV